MGAGHAHALYVHEHSALHHLAPEAKLVAALIFVGAVAVTPREAVWAFGAYIVIVATVTRIARLRLGFVLTRLVAVLPFILFAFLLPFVGTGERIEVAGLPMSREGLWGAWNILAKATIGGCVSILLAGTTEVPDMLRGMGRLKVPPVLTAIAGFMIRYLELIAGELGRMRIAMTARGYDPRWLWQVKPVASSAGALFIRSYERGERVYDAMLARGYTGTMPVHDEGRATPAEWRWAAAPPLLAATVATVALMTT